ncbi:hypothetical protein EV426DRAFT_711737 [Tirmania nivea]|nr:hypothetical protein EV426DRAFT_711737 [Tirmania nivea]
MSIPRSKIGKKVGHIKFNYRHSITRRRHNETPQRIVQAKESPLRNDDQLDDALGVPASGRKRCRGEFDQHALETGVIGRLSLSKSKRTRRGPNLGSNADTRFPRSRQLQSSPGRLGDRDPRRLQYNRADGETRISVCNDINCNGIRCQVSCERAAKRRRSIDNSCLSTDSYTNAELQSALRTQNFHKDTPLLSALRCRHLDRLEEYLLRLKASDAEGGTNSLKEILSIQNEAYDTCLTYAAKQFYHADISGNLTSSLASTVQVLLDYCSSFPEIVMIRARNSLTAIHLLLEHLPTALKKSDSLFFTIAESMVKLCPDVLTLKSTTDEYYEFEERPFEKLKRMLAEAEKEVFTDSAALTRFSDCLKYLCIKHGYDLGMLYKAGEERSLALDLTDYADRSISYKDLDEFRRPSFDAVLQFISIPRSFKIVRTPRLPGYLEPNCHDAVGRHTQYEWHTRTIGSILHWLGKNTVRNILHAQVEDLGDGCDCMLMLMENALWRYRIETWDWRRYNIPISTIYNATRQEEAIGGPNGQQSSVRELNLYWRGEPECLPGDSLRDLKPTTFPELQLVKITIYYDNYQTKIVPPAYKERMEVYLKTCQGNLCQSFQMYQSPVLDWHFLPMPEPNTQPNDIAITWNDPSEPKDDFLDIMYKWGRFLGSTGLRSTRPVTVAILDDGFDLTRSSIKENFKGTPGISFQPAGLLNNNQKSKPYMSGVAVGYKSHGTIMAYYVKQMCPQVRILPIRLNTRDRRNSASRSFAPFDVIEVRHSIATQDGRYSDSRGVCIIGAKRFRSQALEFIAKLEYHVDIVNMSWTIEFPPNFNPEYASAYGGNDETYNLYFRFQKAMVALFMRGIILLCATSDKGRNATSRNIPVYPGAFGFRNPDILTIGSASSDSNRSKPAYTPVHFIFPGENVPLEPDLGGEASGSSVATAVASGMVANILFLVDLVNREDEKHERSRSDEQFALRDKITTRMIADAFMGIQGSPTQTLDVYDFKQSETFGETCEISDFEAEDGRLSRGGLAISKRLLRKLKLVKV